MVMCTVCVYTGHYKLLENKHNAVYKLKDKTGEELGSYCEKHARELGLMIELDVPKRA